MSASYNVQLSPIGSQPRFFQWRTHEASTGTFPLSPQKGGSKIPLCNLANQSNVCVERSLCDSWATCYFYIFSTVLLWFSAENYANLFSICNVSHKNYKELIQSYAVSINLHYSCTSSVPCHCYLDIRKCTRHPAWLTELRFRIPYDTK